MFFEIGLFEVLGVIFPTILYLTLANPRSSAKLKTVSPIAAKLLGGEVRLKTVAAVSALLIGSAIATMIGYFVMPPIAMPFGAASAWLMILWAIVSTIFLVFKVAVDRSFFTVVGLSVLLVAVMVINSAIGWDIINSRAFVDVAGTVTIHEEGDQNIIDVSHPLLVTEAQAMRKANAVANSFGDETNLITLKHPTLGDDAQWYVVTETPGYLRWRQLLSRGGLPGYIKVNADDPTASPEVVVLPEGQRIKYSPYSFFQHNSYRNLRAQFPGSTIYKTYFHVNTSTGDPEFVFSLGTPTLGYYIPVPKKLVVQDATTGALTAYSVGEQPAEYQFVFTQEMLADRVDDWGAYRNGWKSHAFGGANLEHVARTSGGITREGWTIVQDDQVKYYLPMQWRSSTGNIQGVMIADAASSKLDLYIQPATDPEQVRLKLDSIIPQKARGNWEAAEPKEYQIGDNLKIWLAPYETVSTVGKSFQGVGATDLDADIAVYGENVDTAVAAIRSKMLESDKFRSLLASERTENLTISRIEAREEAGNSIFYFSVNEMPGVTFRASFQIVPHFVDMGSKLQVSYLETTHNPENVEAIAIKLAK